MQLRRIDGRNWWVPEVKSWRLAVQIESEDEYYPAIRQKLLDLLEKEGLRAAFGIVRWLMSDVSLTVEERDGPERLVDQILATSSAGEMVRAGAPWMSTPADEEEAKGAVDSQDELTLADFIG